MILLREGMHPREVLWIHRPPLRMKQKKRIQKTFRSLYPFLMMQSASYGFLLICTYLHQALLGLAEFTALFQNFRGFIPIFRELFLSNASSDAGRHPRFPGYPLAFLPSCQSVHSLGRKARNQLCITAALVRQFSFSWFSTRNYTTFSQTVSIIPSKTLPIFFIFNAIASHLYS